MCKLVSDFVFVFFVFLTEKWLKPSKKEKFWDLNKINNKGQTMQHDGVKFKVQSIYAEDPARTFQCNISPCGIEIFLF